MRERGNLKGAEGRPGRRTGRSGTLKLRGQAECREGTVAGSEWVREKVPGGVWGPAGGEFGYGERLGLI